MSERTIQEIVHDACDLLAKYPHQSKSIEVTAIGVLKGRFDQELTSIRNQLAEAQSNTDDEWLTAIANRWKEMFGEPYDVLDGETREEGLLRNRDKIFDKMFQLQQERDQLKQQLLASEASREKLLSGIALILPLAKGYAHANPVGSNEKYVELATDLLSEEPQTSLTEALKGVRELIKYGIEHQHEDEDLCNQDRCNVYLKLQQAISTLEKLCLKGPQ